MTKMTKTLPEGFIAGACLSWTGSSRKPVRTIAGEIRAACPKFGHRQGRACGFGIARESVDPPFGLRHSFVLRHSCFVIESANPLMAFHKNAPQIVDAYPM